MTRHNIIAVLVGTAVCTLAMSNASAAIVIDDFNTPATPGQLLERASTGTSRLGVSGLPGTSVLGGVRDMELVNTGGGVNVSANANTFDGAPQFLVYNQTFMPAGNGAFTLTYDGDADASLDSSSTGLLTPLTTTILAEDFTQGGINSYIILDMLTYLGATGVSPNPIVITLEIFTHNGGNPLSPFVSTATHAVNVGDNKPVYIGFNAFAGNADVTNVNAFRVSVDPGSGPVVLHLNSITAATPEPSSLALLGMGAMSLCGYGWRRRRQQGTTAA